MNRVLQNYLRCPAYCQYCGKQLPLNKAANKYCSRVCGAMAINNKDKPKKVQEQAPETPSRSDTALSIVAIGFGLLLSAGCAILAYFIEK